MLDNPLGVTTIPHTGDLGKGSNLRHRSDSGVLESPSRGRRGLRSAVISAPVLAIAAVLGAVVISWTTTSSAISHRTAANEANNLRHSAATVAFADAMYGATGSLDNRGLAEALATLDGEHDRALARLDSDERSLADAEITAIVNCGMALRSEDVGEMPPHDHDDLAILLDAAATRASNMADQAETRARYASIVSFTAAMLAAATSMRWRQRCSATSWRQGPK